MHRRAFAKRPTVRTLLAGTALTFALAAAPIVPASAANTASLSGLISPDTDFSRLCTVTQPRPPSRDWSVWDGEETDADPATLLDVARQYASGSTYVTRDKEMARRMLEYLVKQEFADRPLAKAELGRLLLDPASGPLATERGVSLVEDAAASGVARALMTLAELSEDGTLVPKDIEKAQQYYRQASLVGDTNGMLQLVRLQREGLVAGATAEQADAMTTVAYSMLLSRLSLGDCAAIRQLANLHADASSPLHDADLARRWYEAAARMGDTDSAIVLAGIYRNGDGVPRDSDRAIALLQSAADAGSPVAARTIGEIRLFDGELPDRSGALKALGRANAAKDDSAMRLTAEIHGGEHGGSIDRAAQREELEKIAAMPNPAPKTLSALAVMLEAGLGGEADRARAQQLFTQAADAGDVDAVTGLYAMATRLGAEEPELAMDAVARTEALSAAGNFDAMRRLADMKECGIGVPVDRPKMLALLNTAAALGDPLSLKRLGTNPWLVPDIADRLPLLKAAADKGDRQSMTALAVMYLGGDGVAPDGDLAATWIDRATAPGRGGQQESIAIAAARLSLAATTDEAAPLVERLAAAASDGNGEAGAILGIALLEGSRALPVDRTRAVTLLTAAAERGNVKAMATLAKLPDETLAATGHTPAGWLEEAGNRLDPGSLVLLVETALDMTAAQPWLDRFAAANVCEPDTMVRMARALHAKGDDAGAATWVQRAIELGHPDPADIYGIGIAFRDGLNGQPDLAKARSFLARAADAGYVPAMGEIGEIDLAAASTTEDEQEAARWFERSVANGGNKAAIQFLRMLNERGEPATPLLRDAIALLEKAADSGDLTSMREIGLVYQRGRGVPIDPERGTAWLTRAAEAGDPVAMRELAQTYLAGFGTGEMSPEKSVHWLRRAADSGDQKAMLELAAALRVGFGVPVDEAAADRWQAAANQ